MSKMRIYQTASGSFTVLDKLARLRELADKHQKSREELARVLDSARVWAEPDSDDPLSSAFELAVWAELPTVEDSVTGDGFTSLHEFLDLRRELRDAAHGRALVVERGRDVEYLLRQVGDDEYVCRLCESTDVVSGSVPSMYAGEDPYEQCNACGAYTTTDPFSGVYTIWRKPACPGCSLSAEYPGPAGAIVSVHKIGCPEVDSMLGAEPQPFDE